MATKFFLERTIPACAGTTPGIVQTDQRTADHPRVCGDNILSDDAEVAFGGPSPRVRGQPITIPHFLPGRRTIPACAGTTHAEGHCKQREPDHPRVCGDNAKGEAMQNYLLGPSPRVRGQRVQGAGVALHDRTIPACAGTTRMRRRIGRGNPDHPRVCGDNLG